MQFFTLLLSFFIFNSIIKILLLIYICSSLLIKYFAYLALVNILIITHIYWWSRCEFRLLNLLFDLLLTSNVLHFTNSTNFRSFTTNTHLSTNLELTLWVLLEVIGVNFMHRFCFSFLCTTTCKFLHWLPLNRFFFDSRCFHLIIEIGPN